MRNSWGRSERERLREEYRQAERETFVAHERERQAAENEGAERCRVDAR